MLLCFCFAPLWGAVSADASERILEMNVLAVVQKDASVLVTEEIRFISEGKEIKRGLIRSIPVRYSVEGKNVRIGFAVKGATLDGARVPYEVSRAGADLEIRLGRANVLLPPGEHVYVLNYRVSDVVLSMRDHDELYWNVTGDRWAFPIERASFRVALPGGILFADHSVWTGRPGSKGDRFRLDEDGFFRTTASLRPGEGFTVAVGWPKGIVASVPSRLPHGDSGARAVFSVSLALMVGWYVFAWLRWGKDPHSQGVFPRFEPPFGMEPGLVRYAYRLDFDLAALSADILYLATQGFLSIEERSGDTIVRPSDNPPRGIETLSGPHRGLLGALFSTMVPEWILEAPGGIGETLFPSAHKAANAEGSPTGRQILKVLKGLGGFYGIGRGVRAGKRPALFSYNFLPAAAGLLFLVPFFWVLKSVDTLLWESGSLRWSAFLNGSLSMICLIAGVVYLIAFSGLMEFPSDMSRFHFGRLLPFDAAAMFLLPLSAPLNGLKGTFIGMVSGSFANASVFFVACLFHAIFVFVLAGTGRIFIDPDSRREKQNALIRIVLLVVLASGGSLSLFLMIFKDFLIAGGAFCAGIAVPVFLLLMPARTRFGRRLLDQTKGFRMFLNTAERHRLEFLYPAAKGKMPDETPALFERCLPYALALGVAETWANSFSETLRNAGYNPAWYRSAHGFDPVFFQHSMVHGFAGGMVSTLQAAYPKMGNSSGGRSGLGGGGFSGGGFGGGGGRGW